jgi:parallel beta-helix repeat protein
MNKKYISVFMGFLMLSFGFGLIVTIPENSQSQTIIPAGFHVAANDTWQTGSSPYWIYGNVTIDPGINLTIDPGVEIKFNGFYNIYVEGTLYAPGEESNMITFTSNTSTDPASWESIHINTTGKAVLKYCNISYARYAITVNESSGNEIQNNIISNSTRGIHLEMTSDNMVSNNVITNSFDKGIMLGGSTNNTVENNLVADNYIGIFIGQSYDSTIDSSDNLIKGNNISDNSWRGISLYYAENNTILSNTIYDNVHGIYGFFSDLNDITYNQISSNFNNGIWFSHCDINDIALNNISFNGDDNDDSGLNLSSSNNNLIYHNTFWFNQNQAFDDENQSNFWDNEYPLGGNFWSHIIDDDFKRGANQDIPGSDGIFDHQYDIDSDSTDYYPLATPMRNIAPFLIALISPANESVIKPGTLIDLDILVQDPDTVNYSLDGGGTNTTLFTPFDIVAEAPNWPDGQNRLDVYVIDSNNNVNSSWFTFFMDSTKPNITLISPQNNSKIKAGTVINISIDEPNLNYAVYLLDNVTTDFLLFPYDIDTTGWSNGNHSIEIFAKDLAENNNTASYNFTLDSNAPEIHLASHFNNSYLQPGVPIEFDIVDDHLQTARYSKDGGSYQPFVSDHIIDTSTFPDGEFTVTVWANDTIGNINISSYNLTIDSVAPIITLVSPQNNSVVKVGDPFNFTIIEDNPFSFRYSLNSGNEMTLVAPYLLNTSDFNNNRYWILVNVTDSAGNNAKSLFNITLDSLKPVINLQQLENNSHIRPGTQITFEVYEPNLVFANYSVNDGDYESLTPSNIIDTETWPDGTYTIEIYAMDMTGNFIRDIYVFFVDGTPPQVVSTNPNNNEKGVPMDKSIRVAFSEEMDQNSVLFALSITPEINATVKWTANNRTMIIELNERLANETEYTVTINTSAVDLAENPLTKDYSFSFTTGTKEDDDPMMLILPLLFIMIVIIAIIVFLLWKKRDMKEEEVKDEEEFDIDQDKKVAEKDEDLIGEGLGEEEDDVEELVEEKEED